MSVQAFRRNSKDFADAVAGSHIELGGISVTIAMRGGVSVQARQCMGYALPVERMV